MILVTGASGNNGIELIKLLAATISRAVQDVTGQPARSFAAFVRDYKQAFSQ